MKKISIAMATYNGERYLREQLDSILSQTISFSELVISDDSSTDATWNIIMEYASKDARIKAFQNERNIGFVKNFEKAMSQCTGDYVALSDQDDIWLPEHLEILLNNIGNKMIATGDAELIDKEGKRLGKKLSYLEYLDYVPEDDLAKAYMIFFFRNANQGTSMLVRKELLALALPIPVLQRIPYHDTWLAIMSCFCGGIARTQDIVTLYRRHDRNITKNKRRKARIRILLAHIRIFQDADRPYLIPAIRERLAKVLNNEQRDFLDSVEMYYKRQYSFFGRVANFFFEMKYYRWIYASKGFFFPNHLIAKLK